MLAHIMHMVIPYSYRLAKSKVAPLIMTVWYSANAVF